MDNSYEPSVVFIVYVLCVPRGLITRSNASAALRVSTTICLHSVTVSAVC